MRNVVVYCAKIRAGPLNYLGNEQTKALKNSLVMKICIAP